MTNPYLELARFLFSQPACVEAELRACLPLEIVSKVDWPTLRREPDVTVEPALQMSESVLCFSARYQDSGSIRFVLLLKREPTPGDRGMMRRMMRYMIEDLEHWQEAHPEGTQPPAAFPVVIYFGTSPGGSPYGLDELFALA
jgi:hypothetical protein